MQHITYLFGAGASQGTVPVQSEMAQKIDELCGILRGVNFDFDKGKVRIVDGEGNALKNQLIEDFKWLHNIVRDHGSVDSYAHMLRIGGDAVRLKKLKNVYSCFFVLYQAQTTLPDKRYLPFFNNVFKFHPKFPKELKILTWNYDFQFEKTLSSYRETSGQTFDHRQVQEMVGIYTGRPTSPGDEYSIYKLNGSAGFESINPFERMLGNDGLRILPLKPNELDILFLESVLHNYARVRDSTSDHSLSLHFAFDDKTERLKLVKKATEATQILIVIGYSFPDANREFDLEVINNMSLLNEMYIQDINAHQLKTDFHSYVGDDLRYNVTAMTTCNKFHIPNALLIRES